MNYTLLIVDNEDQTDAIEEIYKLVQNKNFTIECFQFNVGLPDGRNVVNPDSGLIEKHQIIKEFNKMYLNRRFDMIAFDYNLDDEKIFGTDVIKTFNGIAKTSRAKKVMYSAELVNIVQEVLEKYKEDQQFDPAWKSFKTLIQIEIMDFCQRDTYEKNIVNLISKSEVDKLNSLIDLLRGSADLSFNDSIKTYSDKTFGEIADLIETNDSLSEKFLEEYFQMSNSSLYKN